MTKTSGWISWFCSQKGHEILAPVETEFITDVFNLFGLKSEFKDYAAAVKIILSDAIPPGDLSSLPYSARSLLTEAIELYGLIHARYILTQQGLAVMANKFKAGVFGVCPRIMCQKQHVLPVGISDQLRQHSCRVYCPLCQEVYLTRAEINSRAKKSLHYSEDDDDDDEYSHENESYSSMDSLMDEEDEEDGSNHQIPIDGAFFGTTFPSMLLLTYPRLVSAAIPIPHIPQLYGFKQHAAKSVILQKIDNGEYGEHARQQMGSHNDAKYRPRQPLS